MDDGMILFVEWLRKTYYDAPAAATPAPWLTSDPDLSALFRPSVVTVPLAPFDAAQLAAQGAAARARITEVERQAQSVRASTASAGKP